MTLLRRGDVFVIDVECMITFHGMQAPPLACMSWASETDAGILGPDDAVQWVERMLREGATLVGHRIAFDMGVLVVAGLDIALVFRAYREGRIKDTHLRQQLIDLAQGRMFATYTGKPYASLADLSERLLKVEMQKGAGTYQTCFHLFLGVPLGEWPREATEYAIKDSVITRKVFFAQGTRENALETLLWFDGPNGKPMHRWGIIDEDNQARASWALHLISAWGMRVDHELLAAEEKRLEAIRWQLLQELAPSGLIVRGSVKQKILQQRILEAYDAQGISVPLTEKGHSEMQRILKTGDEYVLEAAHVSYGGDALRGTGVPELALMADYKEASQQLSSFVRPLLHRSTCRWSDDEMTFNAKVGITHHGCAGCAVPVTPRFDSLKESGRTSCREPNMQAFPKKGRLRECIIPRDGNCLIDVDFDELELRTLAQVCIHLVGFSRLAETFRLGRSPHLALAVRLAAHAPDVGVITYEQAAAWYAENGTPMKARIDELRAAGKIINFAKPGGMGVDSLTIFCRNAGLTVSRAQAADMSAAYETEWSEVPEYFKVVGDLVGDSTGTFTQLYSGRRRGRVDYPQACNTGFQGLASDGVKDGLFEIAERCYARPSSNLYGCRVVNFIHDENLMEAPLEQRHEAGFELAQVMCERMQAWCPDVPITASPAAAMRWYKKMQTVLDDSGRLQLWSPAPAPKEIAA